MIAAAAAKSLQSCPALCDPTDGSPPGSLVPGILQARTLEWVTISFSNAWKWKWSRSVVFADKITYSQSYGFSSSHVQMGELDHKKGWVPKNWCFQTVVLEKTLESLLDCKEIKPVNPKGNQPEYSLVRLMLKLKLQ